MKKNGFTLVELLAVIVLLASLLLLVSYSIINVTKRTNDTLDESTKKVLYNASEEYLSKYGDLKSNGDYTVSVNDLINKDIINSNLLEAQNSKKITRDSCIKVNYTNGHPSYDFSYSCE